MTWLIDADAFICLRKMDLLALIEAAHVRLDFTAFVARHELNGLQADIARLETDKLAVVHEVMTRTPEHTMFRTLKSQGADKGEAETIAWAVHNAPSATFVSNDRAARALASTHGLANLDILGFLVALERINAISRHEVFARLAHWDDQGQFFCRPSDFTNVAATWAARGGR